MVASLKEAGARENRMGKVFLLVQMGLLKKGFGKWVLQSMSKIFFLII